MRNRNAYTLIELLVAMALASAMIVTVMALLTSLDRHQVRMKKQSATLTLDQALADFVSEDLLHAQRVMFLPNEIQLTTYRHLDPQTLRASHRPVQIIYRLQTDEIGSSLIRDQYALDVPASSAQARVSSHLMAWGVTQFALMPVKEKTTAANRPSSSWSVSQPNAKQSVTIERIPREMDLILQWSIPNERRHQQRLGLH